MEQYAQYHQPPTAYPHAHQQTHPNQPSPIMQTQQQPNYAQHQQPQQMAHPQMMAQMPYNAAYTMQQPYASPSHAAAMATAAASGYPAYSMPDQQSLGMHPKVHSDSYVKYLHSRWNSASTSASLRSDSSCSEFDLEHLVSERDSFC